MPNCNHQNAILRSREQFRNGFCVDCGQLISVEMVFENILVRLNRLEKAIDSKGGVIIPKENHTPLHENLEIDEKGYVTEKIK